MATVDGDTATLVLRHKVNTNEMASFVLEDNGDDHVRARDIVFHRHTDASPSPVARSAPLVGAARGSAQRPKPCTAVAVVTCSWYSTLL